MENSHFARYIWLFSIIYHSKGISFNEINEKWKASQYSNQSDLPKRTFRDWCKKAEEIFDVNIVCEKGGDYKFYIENIDEIKKSKIRSWILDSFSINNLLNSNKDLYDRIICEKIQTNNNVLTLIMECLRNSSEISMSYKSFKDNQIKQYDFQPYCLKVFKQRWYIYGFCPTRNATRIFALDRIHSIQTTGKIFQVPNDFNAEKLFNDCYGIIMTDSQPETVMIKVYDDEVFYLRSLPLHESQKEISTHDFYSIFEFKLKIEYDFKQEILSRGYKMEVLSPLSLRKDIANNIKRTAELYKI